MRMAQMLNPITDVQDEKNYLHMRFHEGDGAFCLKFFVAIGTITKMYLKCSFQFNYEI